DRRFDVSVGVLLVVVALLFQAVAFAQILMPPRPPPSGPPLPRGHGTPPGPQSAPPSGGSGGVVRGLPTRFPRGFGAAATPLPDTDFVWTWGEPSADDEEIATRVREDGFVIVRVEGRQDAHSCELIAELVDFLDPDSE